jgi:hypothetical protein
MRLPDRRWIAGAAALVAVLVALIPIGRWEARRHARSEIAGMRSVLAAIGPFDNRSLDAYRQNFGTYFDCLLYKRGSNPFALEFCFDPQGRVVEAINRLGTSPKIWSLREDPSASTIHVDRAALERLIASLEKPA